jgi:hypothetical protein
MPPRPGTPGYEDFIAHKQAVPDAGNPAAAAAQPGVQPAPSASAPPSGSAPPADTAPSTDAAVARGGLY